MRFIQKIGCYLLLLQCVFIIGWNSITALIKLKIVKSKRSLINYYNHTTAIKILKTLKVNYKIYFEKPLNLHPKGCYIFMSNHQSILDIPVIGASIKGPIRLIAKQEIFNIPLLGAAMQASEYIFIDRDHPSNDFFYHAKEKLRSGIWLWIFPEGTRSKAGELLPFKSGGFRLAREIGATIIPVGIVGTKNVLPKKTFNLKLHQQVELRIGQPIDATEYPSIEMQRDLLYRVQCAIAQLIS
ncbi:MAG TPA: lysophospholipid acyltransferase family protein [Gammaproteobacteria bacterium]|nr:lysophospholipid acyltransferase family protein [Gammaproteobacteria bacterium]